MSIKSLIKEASGAPLCTTCSWYRKLPDDEREAFDQYVQLSEDDSRRYSRKNLWLTCVEMGYPLKDSVFVDCVRKHHVHK